MKGLAQESMLPASFRTFSTKLKMKILLLLLVCFSMHCAVMAQPSAENTVTVDFATKKITWPTKKTRENDIYYVKIENINLNLYKINFTNQDTVVASAVQFPTLESVGIDVLKGLVSNIPSFTTSAKLAKEEGLLPEIALKDIRFQKHAFEVLDATSISEIKKEDNIKNKFDEYKKIIKASTDTLNNISIATDRLVLAVNRYSLNYITTSDNALKGRLADGFDVTKILDFSSKLRTRIQNVSKMAMSKSNEFDKYVQDNLGAIREDDDLKKGADAINDAFSALNSTSSKVYSSVDAGKVTTFLTSIINMENNKSTAFISLPLQLKGDYSKIKIKIDPIKSDVSLPRYETELKFPTFSSTYIGAGISIYRSGLTNEAYSTIGTQVGSNTTYKIVKEDNRRGEIGLASLLHFGAKFLPEYTNNLLGVHATLGPALSISNTVRPRLAAGGGVAVGKKQALSVDFLGMGGYTDQRSNAYDEKQTYSVEPTKVTVAKLDFKFTIALGYIYKF